MKRNEADRLLTQLYEGMDMGVIQPGEVRKSLYRK